MGAEAEQARGVTTGRYPRRIIPLWWSWRWRQWRRRLITRRPPEAWEPGYREWATDQSERIRDFMRAARRDGE